MRRDMNAGDAIWWLHTPRGGWGYTERVYAIVVKPGRKRVGIAVLKKDWQTWVPKWVRPEHINVREVNESSDILH
jgi:ketosteroid isomerase-like protein